MSTPEDDSAVKKPVEDATSMPESSMTNGDEAGKDVSIVDKAAQECQAEEQPAGSEQPGDEKATSEEQVASEAAPTEDKSTKVRPPSIL